MRKLVAALFILFCSTSLIYGQKTRYGQAAETPKATKASGTTESLIKVHISATRIRSYCASCNADLYADAVLNGKKIELSGVAITVKKHSAFINLGLIIPGDYEARLTKDIHNSDGALMHQEYDLLLPDGTVWHCATTGISE